MTCEYCIFVLSGSEAYFLLFSIIFSHIYYFIIHNVSEFADTEWYTGWLFVPREATFSLTNLLL